MKNKIIALFIALGAVSSANAQFGGLSGMLGGGKSSGGGDVGAMADEFKREASAINEVMTYSLIQIVGALGDKQQIAAVKVISENLAKTTDPKEKDSIQGTAIKEQAVVAAEVLKSKEAQEKIGKMSPEMQQKVVKSIVAVGVAIFRVPVIADKGKKVLEGLGSNPMNIAKALPVKDGMVILIDAAPKLPSIFSTGFQMLRDAKLDPVNPTADTKVEAIKDPSFAES